MEWKVKMSQSGICICICACVYSMDGEILKKFCERLFISFFGLYFDGGMVSDNWSAFNVEVKCSSSWCVSGAWCFVYLVAKLLIPLYFPPFVFSAQKIIKSAYYVPNHKQGRMLFIYQVWHDASKLTLI